LVAEVVFGISTGVGHPSLKNVGAGSEAGFENFRIVAESESENVTPGRYYDNSSNDNSSNDNLSNDSSSN